MSTKDILLAGVGGQGTVLASKILARCAIARGEKAHTAETIGMAQRGGCVTSHVRLGECYAPLIARGCADCVIAFEPAEAVRALPYLKKGGAVIVNTAAVKPVTDTLASSGYEGGAMTAYIKKLGLKAVFIDAESIARECGSSRVVNMALLGAAAAVGGAGAELDEIAAVVETLAPRFREANLKALALGAEAAKAQTD